MNTGGTSNVKAGKTLVVGLGEVGGALAQTLERIEPVLRLDVEPWTFSEPVAVMHLCFPFRSPQEYEAAATQYIRQFHPRLTIINSTVLPGTTSAIASKTRGAVAYSPVRGKHAKMTDDLRHYVKFVAAPDRASAQSAAEHFERAEMKTRIVNQVETLELAKLAETSYFGVLIAFAQELNRYCELVGGDYHEAISFFEEVDFLPRERYFPGFIGGHCVMPNINLMLRLAPSPLLKAIATSNELRARELSLLCGAAGSARDENVDGRNHKVLDVG
jgi:UDP-glucose/GDP-mannose dehydrogenase family protein